jgi:hypothetical protein
MMRKAAKELSFSRGGVRHVVKAGESFNFTDEEIQSAEKLTRGIFYPVSAEEPPPPAPEPAPEPAAEAAHQDDPPGA